MRVAVLMGGVSREREISLLSGEAVARALAERGHDVSRIVVEDETVAALAAAAPELDVAFLALHGRFGEDGGVQRLCERLRLPYTGSGPEASALAMDKDRAKRAFERVKITTPPWITAAPPFPKETVADIDRAVPFGLPWVVKPVSEGSSIGVTVVRERAELGAALAAVQTIGDRAMIEPFIEGREFTIGVLGDRALPPIELRPRRAFYDFEAKYDSTSGTEYVIDPPLEASVRSLLLETGERAHRALGCIGCSRVDIRLSPAGAAFVLEVNTIPGMTARSLLPKAAAAAGIEFGALCERLLGNALARSRVEVREAA